ncbi:MAG: hypothetical protein H6506_00470 [Calditrichaeota bacterium]|nr:hypothetical protein [Calditrichota bacterium]MCB9391110.1 hypothetical protein [Calditrichota bacterium]
MNEVVFSIGDRVRHKTGGPIMIILRKTIHEELKISWAEAVAMQQSAKNRSDAERARIEEEFGRPKIGFECEWSDGKKHHTRFFYPHAIEKAEE